jgi:carbon storage regulator
MLVLSRKYGERIRIGEGIEITVVGIDGNRVRLGIDAPARVRVLRGELEADANPDRAGRQPAGARPLSKGRRTAECVA